MLRVFDEMPHGLLEVDAAGLCVTLGGPSLIRIPGDGGAPLLIATLLHGNETTGWNALRHLLRERAAAGGVRPLLLFIGNVEAARAGLRHLDHQPDFNRIWRDAAGPEAEMAARVLAEVERAQPVACVDVHNTSGRNPMYACVHRLDGDTLALAGHFSETAVLVTHPESLLSMALSSRMPAITLECGKPGNDAITRRVAERLDELTRPGQVGPGPGDTPTLLRCVARVRIPEHVSFSFDEGGADLRLAPDLDALNFDQVPAGTPIAFLRPGCDGALVAVDEHGADVSERFFRRRGDALVTAVPVIPSLFTPDPRIIRQDCLCYLMERL